MQETGNDNTKGINPIKLSDKVMPKKEMDTLVWNNLYWMIERSYQQTLCCQRYVDRKRKAKRRINLALVIIPGLSGLAYFWEPVATAVGAGITAIGQFFNNVLPLLSQPDTDLSELDELSKKFADVCNEAENLVVKFKTEKEFGNSQIQKIYKKLQERLNELESRSNVLIHHVSNKENNYLKQETLIYLKKYANG